MKFDLSILSRTFSSLSQKNFRYFWFGQLISTVGGMIQITALSWYVYKITGSPILLGLMGVFEYGPVLIFSLFAGVYIDRFSKKKILLITQSIFLIQSLLLAVLVWQGSENYWYFAALALFAGIANSFDQATRQAFIVDLVGKEQLTNAISLNSTTFNLARIIGPAIAGLIMRYIGMAECFFINGISFIPVIIGILMISVTEKKYIKNKAQTVMKEVKMGVAYTFHNVKILPTFLIMAVVCTFFMNANVVLPVFAKDIMLGDERTFGFLMSMMGAGSLAGTLFMANYGKDIRSHYFLIIVAIIIAVVQMLTVVPFYNNLIYVTILFVIMGFANLCFLNRANARIQLNTADSFRGRVMSIYALVNVGSTPIGNAFAGFAMGLIGERCGFFICGLISFVFIIFVSLMYKHHITKGKVVA